MTKTQKDMAVVNKQINKSSTGNEQSVANEYRWQSYAYE